MTNPDLTTWVNAVATLVQAELPLQSLDDATNLAFTYLSNIGGWVPDSQSDPNGPGQPANDFTEQQSADAIVADQIASVYDIHFTITAELDFHFVAQLGSGLDLDSAASSMSTAISDFLAASFAASSVPVRLNSVDTQTPISGSSLLGGSTTETIRQAIQADINSDLPLIDYKSIALSFARTSNGLDTTWNVGYVYTQAGDAIVIQITKYTDTTYATLDSGTTTFYIYSISPSTYQIISGVTITPSS